MRKIDKISADIKQHQKVIEQHHNAVVELEKECKFETEEYNATIDPVSKIVRCKGKIETQENMAAFTAWLKDIHGSDEDES